MTPMTMTPTMNRKYTMVIQWSEEDKLYLVHFPEFPWQKICYSRQYLSRSGSKWTGSS
jgi:hypothetical protein